MKWFAQMPSNIALIKYMGKTDATTNTPSNSSLSYTLNDLLSFVELESISEHEDFWETLSLPGGLPFSLSEQEQQKYLNHLKFIKQELGYTGNFIVRSCNNFPKANGLASSASSFAALTRCAVRAICELNAQEELSAEKMAVLSRHGSGSSCRSFFEPWALWTKDSIESIDLPYPDLIHHVVVISEEEKAVSSSEAHKRAATSPQFQDRIKNAEQRLQELTKALNAKDWQTSYRLVWDDFMEMHQLFATAAEPFQYINAKSQKVLTDLEHYWNTFNDGPLVTMDAGPNVHLLFRNDQSELALEMKQKFLNNYDVI